LANAAYNRDCERETIIESGQAALWYERAQWRATAGLAAIVALLASAPLSRSHNAEVGSLSSYRPSFQETRLESLHQGNIRSSAEARALAALRTTFANPSCSKLVARIQLGEPLLDEGWALLRSECRR
jgi:hypothetical protein